MRRDPKTRALEFCLMKIQSGASIDEALEYYPYWAAELRLVLEAAKAARRYGSAIQVPQAAQQRSRAALLEAAMQRSRLRSGLFSSGSWRFSLAALALVVVLSLGAFRTVTTSAQSLPGDTLYPLKLASERARLFFADGQAGRLEMEQNFDQERLDEVEALVKRSRSARVNFAGGLQEMQPGEWLVGSIHVLVPDDTQIVGQIQTGYYVDVQGILQHDGKVRAERIQAREYDISGRLENISPQVWIISGIPVKVGAETLVQGVPSLGSQAQVKAFLLLDQSLLARLVQLSPSGVNAPVPETQSPQPGDTVTPEPTVTFRPEQTETVEPSESVEPNDTLEPLESETPEASQQPAVTEGNEEPEPREPTEVKENNDTPEPTEVENHLETPQPTEFHEEHGTPQPTEIEDGHETSQPTEHEETFNN